MGQLDGKVSIVTGSGRGIGQQVALRLARDGAAVVVNDLDDAPAKETIALIEKLGAAPSRATATSPRRTSATASSRPP
jgi:3-oxoacyl-[acyl-carrier protein] reductase